MIISYAWLKQVKERFFLSSINNPARIIKIKSLISISKIDAMTNGS